MNVRNGKNRAGNGFLMISKEVDMAHKRDPLNPPILTQTVYFHHSEKTPAFGGFWHHIPWELRVVIQVVAWIVSFPFKVLRYCYRLGMRTYQTRK